MPTRFKIPLESKNTSNRPGFLVIRNRKRPASATSVKLLDRDTLVCCSFLGRTLYLIHMDPEACSSRVLSSVETTHKGEGTETDLCDANRSGQIITSNFYKGSFTQYHRSGDFITKIEDLGIKVDGFVHGVKFVSADVIAVTATTGQTGVHFFDRNTSELLLFVSVPTKTQDVCFVAANRMVVLTTHGAPKRKSQPGYRSDLLLFEFDIAEKSHRLLRATSYTDSHFDCAVAHQDQIYLTDQVNDCVKVFDPTDLRQTGELGGFSFPHGLDIAFGLMAVTNYGTNDIHIIPMPNKRPFQPIMATVRKQRYRISGWLRRKYRALKHAQ